MNSQFISSTVCTIGSVANDISIKLIDSRLVLTNASGAVIKLCPLPSGYELLINGDDIVMKCYYGSSNCPKNYQLVFLRKLVGTYRSLILSAISGLNVPYTKTLRIFGPGYKSIKENNNLVLSVGYSHKVIVPLDSDVAVSLEANGTTINLKSHDKQKIGAFAAKVLHVRKPNKYKQCGIYDESKHYTVKQIKKK